MTDQQPNADEIYDQSCACKTGPKGTGRECERCGGYTKVAMDEFMARLASALPADTETGEPA